MTVSLKHATQAAGVNNSRKQVSRNAWNEEHSLRGTPGKTIAFDDDGNAGEIDPGAAIRGYVDSASGEDASTPLAAKFTVLGSQRTSPAGHTGWGVGKMSIGKGAFPVDFAAVSIVAALGYTFSGQGPWATDLQRNTDDDAGVTLTTYVYAELEDFSLRNVSEDPGTSVGLLLNPDSGGGNLMLRRIEFGGWAVDVKVAGTQNGDTLHAEGVNLTGLVGLKLTHYQSVGNLILGGKADCADAVFETSGASETTFVRLTSALRNSFARFLPGAGGGANHLIVDSAKFEYSGGDMLILDARQIVSASDGGHLVLNDVNLLSGTSVPADLDAHRVIDIANGIWSIIMRGGRMRGAINYATTANDTNRRWLFDDVIEAPLPANVTLSGVGAHPLMEWRGCGNVVDQYRGGQLGNRVTPAIKAYHWRSLTRYIVNTGSASQQTDYDGRKGAQFSITDLPEHCILWSLIANHVSISGSGDTLYELFSDSDFATPIGDAVTVAGNFTGSKVIMKPEVDLPAGAVYLRITKPSTGQSVIGSVTLNYQPMIGR